MSVNPVIKPVAVACHQSHTTSSILSDYEDIEVASVDDESFVLFNPIRRQESDILSLTNSQDTDQSEQHLHQHLLRPQVAPLRSELVHRINKWNLTNDDEYVDDNVASWDLDEKLRVEQGGLVRDFYGDDLFKRMAGEDVAKVKKVTKDTETWLRKECRSWSPQWSSASAALARRGVQRVALGRGLAVGMGVPIGPVVSRGSSVSVRS